MKNTTKVRRAGLFITFEGPEGAGKSTQIKLLSDYLKSCKFAVVATREPGGTPLAEELRAVVKNHRGPETMHPMTELLLIEAARSQHVREVILPALHAGKAVLCDRYTDSSLAYQGGGRKLSDESIHLLNDLASSETRPDLTILFHLDPERGFARTRNRAETQGEYDRFELENDTFHRQVMDRFLALAAEEPHRIKIIDAAGTIEHIHQNIVKLVDAFIAVET